MTERKMKIEFAPGCFDGFEGTQQELDELVNEITRLADSGELFENSRLLEDEDIDQLDDDERDALISAIEKFNDDDRQLQ